MAEEIKQDKEQNSKAAASQAAQPQAGQGTQEEAVEAAEHTADLESAQAPKETEAAKEAEEALKQVDELKEQLREMQDKFLRQAADFDNFRKRTSRERLELIQTAGKDLILALLPVLDDSDRAEEQSRQTGDIEAVREGFSLVFAKLRSALQARGLRRMESKGADFNPEYHEAISEIPAPTPTLVGKVVDELECGYYLNDRIIRFAKVVVGK